MSKRLKTWFRNISYKIESLFDFSQKEYRLRLLEKEIKNLNQKLAVSNQKPQKLGLNVNYFSEKYPSKFEFLNSDDFLYNAKDLSDWSPAKQSWYLTEYDLSERYHFLVAAIGYISARNVVKDYYEFGCFGANTFRMVLSEACKNGLDDMFFFAFDSFEGLPVFTDKVNSKTWEPGSMAMSEDSFWNKIKSHGIYLNNIETFKGFYSETLTTSLQEKFVSTKRKAALINIDCDLSASAKSIFEFIKPLIAPGTIIYMDEYYVGDLGDSPMEGIGGVFHEFEKQSNFSFIPFRNVGWWGKSFICV